MSDMAKYPGMLQRDSRRFYTVRVKVPVHLQEIVAQLLSERGGHPHENATKRKTTLKRAGIVAVAGRAERKREIWRSTRTADQKEAKRLYPKLRDEINGLIAEAERRYAPSRKATEAELHLLVRSWFYRWNQVAEQNFQQPASAVEHVQAVAAIDEDDANTIGTFDAPGVEDPGIQQIARRFIQENRIDVAPASRDWWQVVRLIQAARLEHSHRERDRLNGALVERAGDPFFSGITASGPAPHRTEKPAPMKELFDAWAKERKFVAKTKYSWERVLIKLARYLGHEELAHADAGSVTDLNIIGWKDALVSSSLAPKTIANHLTIVRSFFRWASKNKRISANPAAEVEYKAKDDPNAGKLSFDDDDARSILLAARREKEAHKRWAPWLCAFSGARIDEVCGAMVPDVKVEKGIHYIRIDAANREEGGSVKNAASIRNVPLHPAIIQEGFLKYVEKLPKGGALFPNVTPDMFGKRGGNGSKTIGRWIRKKVGITNKRKQPNHGWRHRFADECRKVGIARDIRHAIDGHADSTFGGQYGSEGYPLAVLAKAIRKIKSPV
jgi:integrase